MSNEQSQRAKEWDNEPIRWTVFEPNQLIPRLSDEQQERAGGVMLGMAVADSWSTATELALCVGDAAATGLALTDPVALGLLARNLRLRRRERGAPVIDFDPVDGVLAAAAVTGLASLHDDVSHRADAVQAVVTATVAAFGQEVAALLSSDDIQQLVLPWVEVLVATVRTGAIPADENGSAGSRPIELDSVLHEVHAAELAPGSDVDRFVAGLESMRSNRAASGALLGGLLGWHAVPDELADAATGWPDVGPQELLGTGFLAARVPARSLAPRAGPPSDIATVPVEKWTADWVGSRAHLRRRASDAPAARFTWRRSQVVVSTMDADVADV